jgi:hypothetical protein
MNGDVLEARVGGPGSLVERLLASGKSDTDVLEEIQLRALSRPPTPLEARALLGEPAGRSPAERREALEDLLWATLNSKEFLFNH